MFSTAAGWRDGEQIWAVTHSSEEGIEHLDSQGELPVNFALIRDRRFSQQRAADGKGLPVDYIFDIPVALAESLTGYRHDGQIPDIGEQGFEVLQAKEGAGRRKTWLARLLDMVTKS
jgi:hypothetical protein